MSEELEDPIIEEPIIPIRTLEIGKVTLCHPNQINNAVLSGGSWNTNLPLNHLKTPIFSQAARTTDTQLSSSIINCVFSPAKPLDVVALANHNLSVSARVRVRMFANPNFTVELWNSGWQDVWTSIFSSRQLEWEFDNWWLGTPSEEDRASVTSLTPIFTVNTQVVSSMRIEIDDVGNPDGYIQIGRLFSGGAWQPKYNAEYGISYGHQINTRFETAFDMNQTEYAEVKTPKRTVAFQLSDLSEEDGFQQILRMQRTQGLHGEILYTEDVQGGQGSFVKTFIGRHQDVSPLTHPYFNSFSNSINLVEIL